MITSETFYRAECDAPGCTRTLPDQDDHDASHWPRAYVIEQMAEPSGVNDDETWTVVGEQTFCHRHKPGNVECGACDGRGHFRTEHPDPEPGTGKWRFTDCPVCGDKGYMVSGSTNSADGAQCVAQRGEMLCGKTEGHDGNHRDGVAEWNRFGFVDGEEQR